MVSILVVEDDDLIREALELLLIEGGYQPVTCASLAQALELVDERVFALILTDLFAQSKNDALASVTALRDRTQPTPIGILTAWGVSDAEVAAQGFTFLANKPFDVDKLLTSIAAALQTPFGPEDEQRIAIVYRYFEMLTARDWDGLVGLCADNVTYMLPGESPFSAVIQGKEAFRAFTEKTFDQFRAARFDDVRIYATPQGLAARYMGTWDMGDQGEQRQSGSVVFRFNGALISQIGVHLNDLRLSALLATESR